MKRMLRAAALLIAAALLSPCASALSACRAAVLDADTGEVCFARNASEHALIASTTKIMTGLLIAEDCDPDAVVTVPQEAVGIEGSSLYLKAGEQLTVRALLYGLLLHSGNDAAVALALAHSGSVGAFVEAMNGRAQELGLRDTHFTNPNGLDAPEHYSTALDLARLTRAALQVPAFAEVVATRQITIEARSFTNHNRLLWSLDGAAERLRRPLMLDGYRIRPPEVEQTAPGRFLITIHEGRNRQIRRMCAAAGLEVLRLRRIAEGPLQLGTLTPGAWRPLTEAELAALRQETEGGDPV